MQLIPIGKTQISNDRTDKRLRKAHSFIYRDASINVEDQDGWIDHIYIPLESLRFGVNYTANQVTLVDVGDVRYLRLRWD